MAGATVTPLRKPRKCPACGRPSERDAFPFCSVRCADADLGRWFSGAYAVPSAEPPDELDFETSTAHREDE